MDNENLAKFLFVLIEKRSAETDQDKKMIKKLKKWLKGIDK